MLLEFRWHGRGGQGVVTAALLFARAAVNKGLYALAIPFFGAERRGAPVVAFNRVSDKVIRTRSSVKRPDFVAVLDPSLLGLVDVAGGLKEDGLIIINGSRETAEELVEKLGKRVAVVNATGVALELGLKLSGYALANMPMVGAVARVSGVVDVDALRKAVYDVWSGGVADSNWAGVERGFREVKILG